MLNSDDLGTRNPGVNCLAKNLSSVTSKPSDFGPATSATASLWLLLSTCAVCPLSAMRAPCQLSATPWTVAHQAPLSMELPRQEYCSWLPFPSPGDFPTQGSNPGLRHYGWILYHLSYQGSLSGTGTNMACRREGINTWTYFEMYPDSSGKTCSIHR